MPKLIDRQEKKNKILQAALTVFSDRGFNDSKMADIAKEAGMGKGTVYEYFRSKKEIFFELFNYLFQDFDREFEQQLQNASDPTQKIRLLIQIYFVEVIQRYGDFIKIVMDFWAAEAYRRGSEQTFGLNLHGIYSHYLQIITSIIDEGIQKGLFRPVNSRHYAAILLSIFDGLYLQLFLNVNNFKPEEIADSIFNLYLASLTNFK